MSSTVRATGAALSLLLLVGCTPAPSETGAPTSPTSSSPTEQSPTPSSTPTRSPAPTVDVAASVRKAMADVQAQDPEARFLQVHWNQPPDDATAPLVQAQTWRSGTLAQWEWSDGGLTSLPQDQAAPVGHVPDGAAFTADQIDVGAIQDQAAERLGANGCAPQPTDQALNVAVVGLVDGAPDVKLTCPGQPVRWLLDGEDILTPAPTGDRAAEVASATQVAKTFLHGTVAQAYFENRPGELMRVAIVAGEENGTNLAGEPCRRAVETRAMLARGTTNVQAFCRDNPPPVAGAVPLDSLDLGVLARLASPLPGDGNWTVVGAGTTGAWMWQVVVDGQVVSRHDAQGNPA